MPNANKQKHEDKAVAAGIAVAGDTSDPTLYPNYYGVGSVHEVRKCLVAWGLKSRAYLFTCVVYIARAGKKGKGLAKYVEDLEKAKVWLQYEIDDARALLDAEDDEA